MSNVDEEKIKDVNGMTSRCNDIAKPSYDDLKIENDRLNKSCRRLQRLVCALERSLGIQVDEIIELEQDRDFYKQQYYKENERAGKLLDKLEKIEVENGTKRSN